MTSVLAVGAHPDDIELGCGGTLARHLAAGHQVTMLVMTDGEEGPGGADRCSEATQAAELLGASIVFGHLPDGRLPLYDLDMVHLMETIIRERRIDRIYSHGLHDTHQDHRAVATTTWSAGRHSANVLAYESPSAMDFTPRVYVDITDTLVKKLEVLACHSSQVNGSRMASVTRVTSLAAARGHQACVSAAEAFMPHRLLMNIT